MGEEKNLENVVKTFLKARGHWYVKYWGGGGYTRKGVPDLLVCCNGIFVSVELKASRGKPSPLQVRELLRIRESGGIAVLLYPKDLEVFQHLIIAIEDKDMRILNLCKRVFEERIKGYE